MDEIKIEYDKEARISWAHYLQLYKNFYNYFESNQFESPYYNALKYLIYNIQCETILHSGYVVKLSNYIDLFIN